MIAGRAVSTPVARYRIATGTTNITTSAYVEVAANVSTEVIMASIYNGTSSPLSVALGAAGAEIDTVYVPPSSFFNYPFHFSSATRIAVKSLSGTASSGDLIINLFY